jgi:hypothetical protein
VGNPVIVNDPARGAVLYVADYAKLYALASPPVLALVGSRRGIVSRMGAGVRP